MDESKELIHFPSLPEVTFHLREGELGRTLGGIQALVDYPNGYTASIVGGGLGLYGDGVTTFELAIIHGPKICYATPITSDVMGWRSLEEIADILREIASLPVNPDCTHNRPEEIDDEPTTLRLLTPGEPHD